MTDTRLSELRKIEKRLDREQGAYPRGPGPDGGALIVYSDFRALLRAVIEIKEKEIKEKDKGAKP